MAARRIRARSRRSGLIFKTSANRIRRTVSSNGTLLPTDALIVARLRHQRTRPVFAATFERDHLETIAAMDAGGHDIPRQSPRVPLALRRVGLKRGAIPVRIGNPFGGGGTVELLAKVETAFELGAARRGVHVSRIGDVLARCSGRKYKSLADYAATLAAGLSRSHDGAIARVSAEGTLTYEENVSGVKEKLSLEHLQLFAEARSDRASDASGLGFHHITACPCVQETFRHSFVAGRASKRKETVPLLTHTQRCTTRLTISDAAHLPPLPALLNCIDGVVVRSQNTLPREFELLNVYRAHAEP